jgi:hypothetical protein
MPQPSNPIRVLYVIGAARSGSTVLNTLLGSHPNILGAGELGYLPKSGHVFQEMCSCGAEGTKCDFWSRVHAEWVNLGEPDSLEDYATLQRRFELGRFRPKELPRSGGKRSAAYVKYSGMVGDLLAAVCNVSGKRVIVDSTKTPWRAMMLAGLPGVELRVVHLVRHPAGVVWSMKKRLHADVRGRIVELSPRPVLRSCLYWLIFNLQAAFVRRSLPPGHSLRVRYEDLVKAPVDVMRRIGQLLDCNLDRIGAQAAAGEAFRIEHTIAGKRLRMHGTVRLKMDSDWQNHLPPHDRVLCASLTGWLAKIYGYDNLLRISRVNTDPAHS